MKKIFGTWNVYELIWLTIFSGIAALLTILWKDSVFGFCVFLTGVFCVVLTAKGNIWAYAFGMINTLAYAYLAYRNNLFGELGLNMLFFMPMNIIGFIMWKKHMDQNRIVEMKKLAVKHLVVVLGACLIGIIGMGYGLSMIPTQNTPFIDATTNVLSIAATILMVKRLKEQWLLYITLNVFTIIMWSYRWAAGSPDGLLMIVMWSAYLVNAFYGYYVWNKGAKEALAA